jgi:hypothetical protein
MTGLGCLRKEKEKDARQHYMAGNASLNDTNACSKMRKLETDVQADEYQRILADARPDATQQLHLCRRPTKHARAIWT